MQTNGHRQSLGRRIAAALYGSTPLGTLGRAVASHYVLIPQRYRLRPRTVPIYQIFIYHRVNDDFDPFLPSVPVAAFRKQMEFLKKHFSVLSLNELATSSFPENGQKFHVAITFDDGYRDNFLCAFPVLRDLGLPATIFLTTGCLESRELPWYDQISWAFKLTAQPRFSVAHIRGPEASLQGFRERLQSRDKTLVWLRTIEQNDRLRCIGDVLRSLRVPKQISLPNPMLSWEEVRQMTKWNISFGAHTVSHPVLATLTDDQLNLEITGSKRAIEDRLQIPVRHFAYPFGQPSDVGANAKQAVRRAGFSAAVWGFNNPGSDVFELKRFSPRFNPWDFHPGRFAMMLDWYRLTGVGDRKDTGQLGKVEERK
jgi:peptidoglycan/xylan/chitin deacetylase (PgdA/CDA1 family)